MSSENKQVLYAAKTILEYSIQKQYAIITAAKKEIALALSNYEEICKSNPAEALKIKQSEYDLQIESEVKEFYKAVSEEISYAEISLTDIKKIVIYSTWINDTGTMEYYYASAYDNDGKEISDINLDGGKGYGYDDVFNYFEDIARNLEGKGYPTRTAVTEWPNGITISEERCGAIYDDGWGPDGDYSTMY
jgi:hypothetical protein